MEFIFIDFYLLKTKEVKDANPWLQPKGKEKV